MRPGLPLIITIKVGYVVGYVYEYAVLLSPTHRRQDHLTVQLNTYFFAPAALSHVVADSAMIVVTPPFAAAATALIIGVSIA